MNDTAPGTVSREAGPPEIRGMVKGGVPAAGDGGRGHRLQGRFAMCGCGLGRRGLGPSAGSGAGGPDCDRRGALGNRL